MPGQLRYRPIFGYSDADMSSAHPPVLIRPMEAADIPAALAIQAVTYPSFLIEDADAFASRLALESCCCLVATRGGEMIAYLLAHGWPSESPPPVGTVLNTAAPGEILFIHDLAVSRAGRGSGVGRKLVRRAFDLAAREGLSGAELIAVAGAASYWRGLGFAERDVSMELAAKVAAYGGDARWMTQTISDGSTIEPG